MIWDNFSIFRTNCAIGSWYITTAWKVREYQYWCGRLRYSSCANSVFNRLAVQFVNKRRHMAEFLFVKNQSGAGILYSCSLLISNLVVHIKDHWSSQGDLLWMDKSLSWLLCKILSDRTNTIDIVKWRGRDFCDMCCHRQPRIKPRI